MFAIGFHENCHLWMAKRRGISTGGFFFIPFFGGMALTTSRYRTLWDQALVVLAGPFGGGAMAALFAGVFLITKIPMIGVAAVWMLGLNVFNLLPAAFVDGGQIVGTINYTINRGFGLLFKAISTAGLASMVFFGISPVLIGLVLWMSVPQMIQEYRDWKAFKAGKMYLVSDAYLQPPRKLTKKQIGLVLAGYFGTAILWGGLAIYLIPQVGPLGIEVFR